jgi:DNA repair and recombination protein RAD52
MFSDEQNAQLAAPLDRAHVAQRQQSGGKVSYIEGWHAIAEANRIFGFDGWTREMVELRQLGEPRPVDGKQRVEYLARVRITAGGIIRDGCGFGQGIDKDVGQAHESALKEAETDAMKRALMTFGNPFGLALYDKTQSNVASANIAAKMIATINSIINLKALYEWSALNDAAIKALSTDDYQVAMVAFKKRASELAPSEEKAA